MSTVEHYFENLLFEGQDTFDDINKKQLSPEVQRAVEECASYILYDIFCTREAFLRYIREN